MARRAEAVGVAKASMDAPALVTLAALAGAFIAFGGVLATVALAGAESAPWGEHSIANMYFVPLALLVAALDPAFVAAHGLAPQAASLGWARFLVQNLVPVTLGNLIGGTLLVGAVYWFVYLRPRREP
jgi:formate/nitrite transporter FocA (FNT family)